MAKSIELSRRAYHHDWYLAHRASHRARANVRYRAHRAEVIERMRAYRKTAAGMLSEIRHSSRQRGTR